jgi:Fic family protein
VELYAATWMGWAASLQVAVPVGVATAVARFTERLPDLILNEMRLEGIDISEPQLDAVLAGRSPAGVSESDVERILAYRRSVEMMLAWVESGDRYFNLARARDLNQSISAAEGVLEPGVIRGEGHVLGGGHVSGPGFRYSAPDSGEELSEYITRHLRIIDASPDSVLRAMTIAALFAYAQPFFDGNKRTGRLAMNYELLVNGFDGIIVPASREREYVAAVAEMYRTADATPYTEFLRECLLIA